MFESIGQRIVVLGGAAGLTFCLAGGVAVGLVPQVGQATPASVGTESAQGAKATTETVPDTVVATTAAPEAPAPAPAGATTTVARPRSAAAPEVAATSSEPESTPEPAPSAPSSGPTTAARLNPSSAQVMAAIAQIKTRIPLYSPTETQARDFADQVCSAFDQGQSGAQVKANALQAASKVPFVKVSASDVGFAVSTAVQLVCPGYSSQV